MNRNYKLGKKSVRVDKRTLKLSNYLGIVPTNVLPPIKPSINYAQAVSIWPMYRNDIIGDCTCAAVGHMIQCWTANATGSVHTLSDDDIIGAYTKITGYNPTDGSNDNGAIELDVLNYWKNTGISDHKIGAYASVNIHSDNEVKSAIDIFGGAYLGVQLPITAQNQEIWVVRDKWSRDSYPGSWGGHAINAVGYDVNGVIFVSWGKVMRMSWEFWHAYVDEVYAIITNDFLNGSLVTPGGFGIQQLNEDLNLVTK